MFVKRDLRKINELIHDPEAVKNLSLSRRPAEFSSSLKPLINPTNLPLLSPVLTLSVYDCEIDDVTALGKLGGTNVQEINIGRNPVKILPNDLAVVDSLTRFWAEDCLLEGEFPEPLYNMPNLEDIRLSGNKLRTIDEERIGNLVNLKSLCLDNNELTSVPDSFEKLVNLESLMLRQNRIESLGGALNNLSRLTFLHISSNKLSSLPEDICGLISLETLYANGNQIQTIPSSLSRLQKLKKVQLSNNDISVLPIEFTQRFGEVEDTTGILKKDAAVSVLIIGNPIVEKLLDEEKRRAKEEKEGQKNGGMEVEELTTETEGNNAEVMDTN